MRKDQAGEMNPRSSGHPSSRGIELEDDYDGENLETERRLITQGDDLDDDNFLNAQPRNRLRLAREDDYSPERDGNPRFQTIT